MNHRIAANVLFLRESMELTQEPLAEYVGSSASQIRALESGRTHSPGFFIIARLARLAGVSSDDFVSAELHTFDRAQRAQGRLERNFDENDWVAVARFVEATTRDQAREGRFRGNG